MNYFLFGDAGLFRKINSDEMSLSDIWFGIKNNTLKQVPSIRRSIEHKKIEAWNVYLMMVGQYFFVIHLCSYILLIRWEILFPKNFKDKNFNEKNFFYSNLHLVKKFNNNSNWFLWNGRYIKHSILH